MATSEGKVELGWNVQATARMLAVALFVGGSVATALFVALMNAFHLSTPYPKEITMNGPYWGLFYKFGLVIATICLALVKLRQPRGAHIEWNAWGVTEFDGDAVRCAIERPKLKVGTLLTRMQTKGAAGMAAQSVLQRGSLDGAIGGALTLGDDEGRRIYVGEGTQLAWLNDRLSSVADLSEIQKALADRPTMDPELGRGAENRLVGVWLLAIIAYVTALLAGMAVVFGNAGEPLFMIVLAVAVLFGSLRALIPRLHARRLVRAARHLSEPVTLQENAGSILLARTADGQVLKVDPSGWKHPDAGLSFRRGEAWLTKDQNDLETAATRQARNSRVLALRLESWGRLLLPLAALALLGSQLNKFENWKLLAAGFEVPVESTFIGSALLRATPAGVDMVYENGKHPVSLLKGAPEVFAAGPNDTSGGAVPAMDSLIRTKQRIHQWAGPFTTSTS